MHLRRQRAFLASRKSFVVETTLSGTTMLHLMGDARRWGYRVHLMFIGVDQVTTNIERVVQRVANGGHHVPEKDVRRRYTRSMRNLAWATTYATELTIFDNSSTSGATTVLAIHNGHITLRAPYLPPWVIKALAPIWPDL
jgi:predicted ABC-type ATPase